MSARSYPQATYFMRVRGDSMIGAGISENDNDNDNVAVKWALHAKHGSIVVANVDNECGVLMDGFNSCWSKLREDGGDDFDERESFENLLEEVDAFADLSVEYDNEVELGMSPAYAIYYIESADKAKDVVARFASGDRQ